MAINERIVLLRRQLGMSQRVFGETIGHSAGYVNRLENGKAEPSETILLTISSSFGVPISWLREGVGRPEIQSIGDRVKLARKARDYTQEELAEEIHVSRNCIGMIERGAIRPGDKAIENLCNRLGIDKNWLLTGMGHMERTELTPFYNLLRQDPVVREYVRSFIDHLDRLRREKMEESREESHGTIG